MPRALRTTFLVAACLSALQAGSARGYQLQVRADPTRVHASARANSTITVEVRDDSGQPAPDRTEVRFLTTLGNIPPLALTNRGVARTVLTCATTGTAEVSVTVGGDRVTVLVEFTAEAGSGQGAARAIKVEGGWVAYSVERQLVAASDGARLHYRRLTISGQELQYEVRAGVVHAQREVSVKSGKNVLQGERLCYWLSQARGVILSVRDKIEPVHFQGDSLTVRPQEQAPLPSVFDPAGSAGTRTWIVARDVLIIPNERIQFARASVYMDDKHLFSMPYYIASLSNNGALLNQIFSFSSDGGLNLDFPIYYASSEGRVGSLHIRRTSPNGYGYQGSSPGWSLGLEEQYRLGPGGRGVLNLDNLTSETRGFRWQHTQELTGDARADVRLGYYRYDDHRPGTLMGQLNHYLPIKEVDLNTTLRATRYSGRNDWALESTARYRGRPLGRGGMTYSVSATLGYGNNLPGYWSIGSDNRREVGTYGVEGSLEFPTLQLGPGTSFTSSIGAQARGFTGGVRGRSSADLNLGLRQNLGKVGSASLDYSYTLSDGSSLYYTGSGRQRLDASVSAGQRNRWQLSAFSSWALDDDGVYTGVLATYDLPWDRARDGTAKWRFDVQSGYSKFGGWSTSDLRFALGRDIGKYEIRLCYSPTGAGYNAYGLLGTGGTGKKLWLELSSAGF